jgi:hypothetical protein
MVKKPKPNSGVLDPHLKRANILKPQNNFERKANNSDNGPWRPVLTSKPHAKVSLEDSLVTLPNEEGDEQYGYSLSLYLIEIHGDRQAILVTLEEARELETSLLGVKWVSKQC